MGSVFFVGAQIIAYAFASQYYPIQMRSTGVGWASGVGRVGAILGPMMGGFLITMDLPVHQYFLAFAIPGAIAAIAIGFVNNNISAANRVIEENNSNSVA